MEKEPESLGDALRDLMDALIELFTVGFVDPICSPVARFIVKLFRGDKDGD